MRTLGSRIARLESLATNKPGIVVVSGHSDAEHDRAIADLISKGEAQERDLFVCLMRFREQASGASS